MPRLMLVLVAVMAFLLPIEGAQQPATTKQPQSPWPPEGVYLVGDDVSAPRLLAQVEPKYTDEAARQKLQGIVILACVIRADGTVGALQVRQSLGLGLDEQAILAARKWRFYPALRRGAAVPVAVTLNIAFSLPGVPPPSTWPASFIDASPAADTDRWTEDVTETDGLEVRVAYPPGWKIRKDQTSSRLLVLQDDTGMRGLVVGRPRRLPQAPPQPLPLMAVQQFADRMQIAPGISAGRPDRLAFGQGRLGDRWWVWFDLHSATLPSEIVQASQDSYAGVRIWVFVTSIEAQELSLFCHELLPRGLSEAETQEVIKQAGVELHALMKRISVRARRF
jgi:TonB family protein